MCEDPETRTDNLYLGKYRLYHQLNCYSGSAIDAMVCPCTAELRNQYARKWEHDNLTNKGTQMPLEARPKREGRRKKPLVIKIEIHTTAVTMQEAQRKADYIGALISSSVKDGLVSIKDIIVTHELNPAPDSFPLPSLEVIAKRLRDAGYSVRKVTDADSPA